MIRRSGEKPLAKPEVRRFFETLLGGSAEAARSALVGKVGLALSGGGFRASFYHLGVLARLAELDVLRNVEVLSCVSGGSIVGACYWLELRKRLENPGTAGQVDYIDLVRSLIDHFEGAVATRSSYRSSGPPGAFCAVRRERSIRRRPQARSRNTSTARCCPVAARCSCTVWPSPHRITTPSEPGPTSSTRRSTTGYVPTKYRRWCSMPPRSIPGTRGSSRRSGWRVALGGA